MISPDQADDSTSFGSALQDHLQSCRRHALDRRQGGIADRVVFVEKLREALACGSRPSPSFSLLFVHIRRVTLRNDTHGFLTDNHIVDAAAAKLRRRLRATDCLIRSGERGCLILLAKASLTGANAVAARLQSTIDTTDFFYESVAFQIAIGVTVIPLQGGDTVETILDRVAVL